MAGAEVAGEYDFDVWISERFRALNTDEAVFAPYVKSIVEGDESLEEKIDALDGILGELADGQLDVETFREEILQRWDQHNNATASNPKGGGDAGGDSVSGIDLESKLKNILRLNEAASGTNSEDSNELSSKKGTHAAPPDPTLRAAILNQYKDDVTDEDSDREGGGGGTASKSKASGSGGGGGGFGLERNTNAERILNDMKDKREREKAEAAKKREKDKEDRAKQKQQAQERKDKAKKKTAKVERKR